MMYQINQRYYVEDHSLHQQVDRLSRMLTSVCSRLEKMGHPELIPLNVLPWWDEQKRIEQEKVG